MTTLRLPLEIVQGAEFRRRFRAYGDMAKTEPIDYTEYDMLFVVRRRQWIDAPEITRASTLDARITNGGDEGWFEVGIDGFTTRDLPDGDFYYWLMVWPTGHENLAANWLRGPCKVLPGVEI